VTNMISDVLPELNGASRLGASGVRGGVPGTDLPGISRGLAPSVVLPLAAVAYPRPRVRGKAALVVSPLQQDAVTTLFGQTNVHNYMTGVSAAGEGASGPPPDREPV